MNRQRSNGLKMKFAVLVMLLFNVVALAAPRPSRGAKVEDVRFSMYSGIVIINYNLIGDPSAKYKIQLILRKGSDSAYVYFPKALSGDVGEGKFAGQSRQIIWALDQEFPEGLLGSDYYFVVHAEEMRESAGSLLLTWIGSGVAVLVAAATYVILSNHKTGSGSSTTLGFPAPPGRP